MTPGGALRPNKREAALQPARRPLQHQREDRPPASPKIAAPPNSFDPYSALDGWKMVWLAVPVARSQNFEATVPEGGEVEVGRSWWCQHRSGGRWRTPPPKRAPLMTLHVRGHDSYILKTGRWIF